MTARDDDFEQRRHEPVIVKPVWIESLKEGHIVAIKSTDPIPAGWVARPDFAGKPAR